MSWSVNVIGAGDEIAKAFDSERERSASNGMPEAEQRDIDSARDFAVGFVEKYGRQWVQANGGWTQIDPEKPKFGQIAINISPAPDHKRRAAGGQ